MPQGPLTALIFAQIDGETTTIPIKVTADGYLIITQEGGSDAVTIADGADVAEGTKADVAWTGTGDATVIAGLKAIAKKAGYPTGATPISNSSGNVANAAAVATLPGVASKTTYITGFTLAASGATAGLPVIATLAGVVTGTKSYIFTFPTGALVGATPLDVVFDPPLPASAVNTDIVLTLPAGGSGNTNASATAHGFQL